MLHEFGDSGRSCGCLILSENRPLWGEILGGGEDDAGAL